jgi:hypothetical protein
MNTLTNEIKGISKGKVCQVPWISLSPLVREVLRFGGEISSVEKLGGVSGPGTKSLTSGGEFPIVKLPAGHRFFPDCYREQEARFIDWLISLYPSDCWFMTATFKNYISLEKSERWIQRYLARLNQAYKCKCVGGLLKSIYSVEWQQRDVIHFHLIILGKGLGSLSRKRWEFRWRVIGGGFAACYEAVHNAAVYLVKHQIKDNPSGALHLGGSWRGISPPRSLSRCCERASNVSSGEARVLMPA